MREEDELRIEWWIVWMHIGDSPDSHQLTHSPLVHLQMHFIYSIDVLEQRKRWLLCWCLQYNDAVLLNSSAFINFWLGFSSGTMSWCRIVKRNSWFSRKFFPGKFHLAFTHEWSLSWCWDYIENRRNPREPVQPVFNWARQVSYAYPNELTHKNINKWIPHISFTRADRPGYAAKSLDLTSARAAGRAPPNRPTRLNWLGGIIAHMNSGRLLQANGVWISGDIGAWRNNINQTRYMRMHVSFQCTWDYSVMHM